jgi:hypothetical protein
MPNVWAIASGNWSTASIWNTGTVPTASDDVFISGSFTVTINQDINVQSLNTKSSGSAIAAGGVFACSTSRTINANLNTGPQYVLTLSGNNLVVNINGNMSGSLTNGGLSYALNATLSTSTVNISGSCLGGSPQQSYVIGITGTSTTYNITGSMTGGNAGSGTGGAAIYLQGNSNIVNILGNCVAGAGAASNNGIYITSQTSPYTVNIIGNVLASSLSSAISINATGIGLFNITGSIVGGGGTNLLGISVAANTSNLTLNISGSVAGGGGSNAYGINLAGSLNAVNIVGNVTGGTNATAYGVYNNSTSTVNISGSAIATIAPAAYNNSTGILRVISAVGSTSSYALNGVSVFGTTTFENFTFASNGRPPLLGYCKLQSSNNNFASCSLSASGFNVLIDSANLANFQPSSSDVRLGKSYNFGNLTGTMAIPSASYVGVGTPVDNTSGSFPFSAANVSSSVWNTNVSTLTTTGSIGERVRSISTVSSTGDQLISLL